MVRTLTLVSMALAGLVLYVGCNYETSKPADPVKTTPQAVTAAPPTEHGHKAGGHGGLIAEIGRDNYHAETIFAQDGAVKIFTLGRDEARVLEVETQKLDAFAQADDGTDAEVELHPTRQPGDAAGKTSMFMGRLPETLWGKSVTLTVPITINGERFRFRVVSQPVEHGNPMPAKVDGSDEKDLYLTPGGKYTEADITANGRTTASQKFAGIRATHDMRPKAGDRICPVTMTKANPKFTWIIDGQGYQFCCPPCVDEFLQGAKEQPNDLQPAESYVKK